MDTVTITWIILVAYLGLMMYIGYKGGQHNNTISKFAVLRGFMGPVSLGLSYVATTVSTVVFIGIPGWVYTSGLSGLWGTFLIWGGFCLSAVLLCRALRRSANQYGSLSVPDWVGHRYKSNHSRVVFAILTLLNLFYLGGNFAGVALLLSTLLRIDYLPALLLTTCLVVFYVGVGGTYAQIRTDEVQAFFMLLGSILIGVVGYIAVGGIPAIIQALAAKDPVLLEPFNPKFPIFADPGAVAAIFLVSLFFGVQPQLGKIFLALRSERDIRLFLLTIFASFFFLYWVIPGGLYARVINPNLGRPDQAIPTLVTAIFPPVLAALIGISIISAAFSTLDTLLVAMGTSVGNDIYRRWLSARGWNLGGEERAKVDRVALILAKASVPVFGLLSVILAIQQPPYLATLVSFGSFGVISASAGPVLLGLYWKRGTATGASAAAVLASVVFMAAFLSGLVPSIWVAGAIGIAASLAIMYVVSVITAERREEVPAPSEGAPSPAS